MYSVCTGYVYRMPVYRVCVYSVYVEGVCIVCV